MMISLFLAMLQITAYLGAGYFIGREAQDVWDKRDSKSVRSFLLFPYSHHLGDVGSFERDIPVQWWRRERELYQVLTTMFWPLKVAINLPAIVGLGIPKLAGAGVNAIKGLAESKKPAQLEGLEVAGLLPSAEDSLSRLTEKSSTLGHEISRLVEVKRQVDDEIRQQHMRAAAVLSAESTEQD